MKQNHAHVNDEDLLLYASGELDHTSVLVGRHVANCNMCKVRMEQLQGRLAEFSEAYRGDRAMNSTQAVGARETLKARITEMDRVSAGRRLDWRWVAASAACLLLAIGLRTIHSQRSSAELDWPEKPDLQLTPGATVPITESAVCGGGEPRVPVIPTSLQQKVFERYGVNQPRDGEYEVDYLITPELGGATDIRNLWPEPYHDAVWNAHVKDQLEDRLHAMVCGGQVDLATAQRDIASDWIAAYRKYFHTDTPITGGSPLASPETRSSLPTT
ncbi:MAG TPA: hypothetical protein VGG14_04280 [Candidatus Sulfotelmatobacter sp.]|jgi:hypothetical protein